MKISVVGRAGAVDSKKRLQEKGTVCVVGLHCTYRRQEPTTQECVYNWSLQF